MADINHFLTCQQIINDALGEMGLPSIADSSAGADATSRQMWALLRGCGEELLGEYNWQVMKRTWQFTTTTETQYDLPADIIRFVDETGWNNSGRIPLLGPLTDQSWRMLQARQLGGTTLRLQYVIRANKFVMYFAPVPAQQIAIDYISKGWARDSTDPNISRDRPVSAADIVWLPPRAMTKLLKLRWRAAKGFDVVDAQNDYDKALMDAKYNDAPKSDLSLSASSRFPYLGYVNIPDTGFGGS